MKDHKLGPEFTLKYKFNNKTYRGYALAANIPNVPQYGEVECYLEGFQGHGGYYSSKPDGWGLGSHCWILPVNRIIPGEKLGEYFYTHNLLGDVVKPSLPSSFPIKLLSQKAKGIYQLTTKSYEYFKKPNAKFYPQQVNIDFPVFARPCPTVPRHGFVDSRLVNSHDELSKVVKEIEKTGEPVEVVCMPFIQADYSGIVTPAGVTLGLKNDGATSGTSAKYIPAPTTKYEFTRQFHLTLAGIGINPPDVPYGEFVGLYKDDKPTIVQLRGGPEVKGTNRYVPVETLVKDIVTAGGDLLEWEARAAKFEKGTVVWHPNGALSSHYAVHCILHEIPVVCDIEPRIGDVLVPEATVPKLTSDQYETLAQYLGHAIGKPILEPRNGKLKAAIATLHSQGLWNGDNHLLVLRAEGAANLFRYAAAAVFGELRHYRCHGPGGKSRTPVDWQSCSRYERNFVFMKIYRHNIRAIVEALPLVIEDYRDLGWGGAYGGEKWANCAIAVQKLGVGIQNFLHNKNAKTWKQVVEGWNETVNAVHNGGGLLTKHISSKFLDTVAVNPQVGLTNGDLAELVLSAEHYPRNLKPGKVLPKHSVLSALKLYPFDNNVPGFKTTVGRDEELTGSYQAYSSKSYPDASYVKFKFHHVGKTTEWKQNYWKEVDESYYEGLKSVPLGEVVVWLNRGIITKVKDANGVVHQLKYKEW